MRITDWLAAPDKVVGCDAIVTSVPSSALPATLGLDPGGFSEPVPGVDSAVGAISSPGSDLRGVVTRMSSTSGLKSSVCSGGGVTRETRP